MPDHYEYPINPSTDPAVDELIRKGGPFRQIRSHFDAERDAITYYAKWQQMHFHRDTQVATCEICDCGAREAVVRCDWQMELQNVLATVWETLGTIGHVHLDLHRRVEFATYHAICGECLGRQTYRRVAGFATGFFGAILTAVGGGLGPIMFAAATWGQFKPSERQSMNMMVPWAMAAFFVGVALLWTCRRLKVPSRLRWIGRWPIRLKHLRRT